MVVNKGDFVRWLNCVLHRMEMSGSSTEPGGRVSSEESGILTEKNMNEK